ncbi:MAG: porin [Gammaproteobacteria bacterium]|nr:porin [Gammaproteobacteria bacterium]
MFEKHQAGRSYPRVAGLIMSLCIVPQAFGSGFAVPEISTAGVGMANALVANPRDRGAVPYNPAAMAFHQGSWLSIGSLLIGPSFSVETASGSHDSEGADWLAAPMVQAAIRLDERWWAGLSINAPFGLETRWSTGTFPALAGSAALPGPEPTRSNLEILDFTPTVTYTVSDELAVSAGADIYWVKSAELDSSITALEGDGTGWGFNLSALYVTGPFSAGINFHSSATARVDGTYSALEPTMVIAGALPPSQTAELDLEIPWRLQLGVRYEFTPALAVEFDWTRNGWSSFDEIKVIGDLDGSTILRDRNEWDDANAYRLGLTYQLQDRTQLRFGYSYDETPQGDGHFSARVPDSDRHLFGVGVGHDLGNGWQVEAGYMYVLFEERNYRSRTPYTLGGEINGTDAIDGDYDAHAHLIGLEISRSFDGP